MDNRRWRSPTGTGSRPGEPRRGGAASWRGIGVANYVEITTRRAARARRDHGLARGPGRAGDGDDGVGAGPRDQFCAARHRMARRAVREHRLCRARHRTGRGGRRLAFRPLDEARRYDRRQGDRRHHRQGQQDRRPSARGRRSRHRVRATADSGSPAPIARSASSRSPQAAATQADLPADLQGPLAAVSDQTLPVASFPYGTQICEVEVDRRDRCGRDRRLQPRSTMSGAPSTR